MAVTAGYIISILFTAAAVFYDLRDDRNVPLWLLLGLLILGFAFRVSDPWFAYVPALVMLMLLMFMHWMTRFGAADVLLLIGIALLVPSLEFMIVLVSLAAILFGIHAIYLRVKRSKNVREFYPFTPYILCALVLLILGG